MHLRAAGQATLIVVSVHIFLAHSPHGKHQHGTKRSHLKLSNVVQQWGRLGKQRGITIASCSETALNRVALPDGDLD